MIKKHYRKKARWAVFLLFFFISALTIIPLASADLDYLVTLDHTGGPPGTIVAFSINIQNYFNTKYPPGDPTITGETWDNYVGKQYNLLWDMSPGESYQPQYWNIIGYASVDSNGVLWGQTTIPDAVVGHHSISAVYQYNDQTYMDSWTTSFTVTNDAGSGSTTGGGGTPGFEMIVFFCAIIAVLLLLKKVKKS
jgi:hypothetical protein